MKKRDRLTPVLAMDPLKKARWNEGRAVDAYFKDLDRHLPVSAQEEQELFRRYRAGDKSAKKKIILSNLRFVVKVAQRYMGQGVQFADLISEGNRGLVHAVDKFEPDKNFKFISYAVWWIRQSILRAISMQSRSVVLPLNQTQRVVSIMRYIDKTLQKGDSYPTPEEISENTKISLGTVQSLLKVIPPSMSIDMRIGDSHSELTMADTLVSQEEDPLDAVVKKGVGDRLHAAIQSLSDVERMIVEQSYGLKDEYEYTLNEIGQRLGVSRERVRQLRDRACDKMRNFLKS
jgi:RNA polymerase primary sigma factor